MENILKRLGSARFFYKKNLSAFLDAKQVREKRGKVCNIKNRADPSNLVQFISFRINGQKDPLFLFFHQAVGM